MSTANEFLDLPNTPSHAADVVLLPLPYEGTVSYGKGTAAGPRAIVEASSQIETWDEELRFDLESLAYHTADPLQPEKEQQTPEDYLRCVYTAARKIHDAKGNPLVIGLGGEHSLTPPLVTSAADREDLSAVTVVQFDAHADLRDQYQGSQASHASAMRRLIDRGARILAIGIRSTAREEWLFANQSSLVETFLAQELATKPALHERLTTKLRELDGEVYLTFDIDGLEQSYCPGTGTPQPGGLGWWQALFYLRCLLNDNRERRLLGCDVVETVPQIGTAINEFTAAKLVCKIIGYHFARNANDRQSEDR